jgi:hypothetical protein
MARCTYIKHFTCLTHGLIPGHFYLLPSDMYHIESLAIGPPAGETDCIKSRWISHHLTSSSFDANLMR